MTPTRQFLEDARGCDNAVLEDAIADFEDIGYAPSYNVAGLLLRPEVWKAVAKTRGWKEKFYCPCCKNERCCAECECDEEKLPEWRYRQHEFIDCLQDGKSREQALELL